MAKRKLSSEFQIDCDLAGHSKMTKTIPLSPSQITGPSKRAHVEAVVRSVSPGRNSSYFDGELSDGSAVIRMVGFEHKQLQKLTQFCAEQQPCLLRSCDIATGRNGKPEVIVKSYTKLEKSPTNFSIPDPENDGASVVSLINLDQLEDFERVTVKVVVVKLKGIETVGNGKRKQEAVIADETGKATLVLWEDYIDSIEEEKQYTMHRIQVRIYNGKHQLQIPRSGANIQETKDDIAIIDYSEDESDAEHNTAECVSVIGVQDLDIIFTCISCKANIEHHGSAHIAICSKCNTGQKLLDPKVTAKLLSSHEMVNG